MIMPVWLQIFYTLFSVVILGWVGWITRMALQHDKLISEIVEKLKSKDVECAAHRKFNEELKQTLTSLTDKSGRTDRNLIRIGMKMGLDTGELERE